MNAPKDMAEYSQWLRQERGWAITSRTETNYDEIASLVRREFVRSAFWQDLVTRLESLRQAYKLDTDYDLFMRADPPELLLKPYESFLIKTFRKNVVENDKWPQEPKQGWYDRTNVTLESTISFGRRSS